uniref:Fibronectin type-III domain-containing protein n=1 Tax=Echeneis naucrates TaxID=173247 RepID=A0A665WPU6_ECHNA
MFLSVFTLLLGVTFSICEAGQRANTCSVSPKDKYVEVGSDIKVMCQTSCIHGQIFWTLNNKRINANLSKTINSSHTVLLLRHFTHTTATLQCHSLNSNQVLGGTIIRTYTKPRNISCMLHYENAMEGVPQLFTCKWKQQMNSSLKISYAVLVSQSEICKSNVTTCTSRDVHLQNKINLFSNINVTVRARTRAWEAYSDCYEFSPLNILKIIPPKLRVTSCNVLSDHIHVEWKRSFAKRISHCQVKFLKVANDGTLEKVVNKTLRLNENGNITEQLESCTYYKVSARCALDKAPWSDWSQEKIVLTKLNEHDVKLNLWRKVTEPRENGVRKVHVMWTEIPPMCQDTFTYTIKRTGVGYMDTLCNTSTCSVDVNQDAHRINLTVFRNETVLGEDSIYVPAIGENLPQATEIQTSTLNGEILISWKPPDVPVRGYMIDWTHNGNQYYWKESKYTHTTLTDLLDRRQYNITVTPLLDDKAGLGSEALQVCSSVGDPGNITHVTVEASDKSAYVSWKLKSEEKCSDTVINYTVIYSAQKGPTLTVTVDSTKQSILLKDLNPDTQYSVYVKAVALTATSKSIERLFETKRFDPRLVQALSFSGSIVIILVLSLGLCCAIQWKNFRNKQVPDPSLSSLALWLSTYHQKSFSTPSESVCVRVYMEESQRTSNLPLATGYNGNPAIVQTEEDTEPAIDLPPEAQDVKLAELTDSKHLESSGETAALLSSVNTIISPYRSQSSVETVATSRNKQSKCAQGKQQEKTAPMTIYVTLNMFEQSQGR